jgi:ankyrin repeat protein
MKLHTASERGDEAIVQLLIEKGVNIDAKQDRVHIGRIQIIISIFLQSKTRFFSPFPH